MKQLFIHITSKTTLGTISLEGLEFFAYHGFYDEEQKVGNKYSLDITIHTDLISAAQHDRIRETVNYENLYRIAVEVMGERSRLLEHIAWRLIAKVREQYPNVEKVYVSVSKFNPPIGGVCQRSRITLEG
jgi:7,8-dihydroneopterin aldolase/epimerase/oxygenase